MVVQRAIKNFLKVELNSVKDWLVRQGVDANRITTIGYGEDKPIADNKTKEGKQKNRRIEFTRTK